MDLRRPFVIQGSFLLEKTFNRYLLFGLSSVFGQSLMKCNTAALDGTLFIVKITTPMTPGKEELTVKEMVILGFVILLGQACLLGYVVFSKRRMVCRPYMV